MKWTWNMKIFINKDTEEWKNQRKCYEMEIPYTINTHKHWDLLAENYLLTTLLVNKIIQTKRNVSLPLCFCLCLITDIFH